MFDPTNFWECDQGCDALTGLYTNTKYYGPDALYPKYLNDWHFVKITKEDNRLWWTNEAGKKWRLDYKDGFLRAGRDCPYDQRTVEVKEDGTIMFLGEPYTPNRSINMSLDPN